MSHDVEMSIWGHLDELRQRLVRAAIALAIGTAISVVFTQRALQVLILPLGNAIPQTIKPTESFIVYFRIAMIGGVMLAMPVILYEILMFALPGMLPHEKKYLYFLLPGATISFAAGLAFAALIMLPAAITFMQSFLNQIIENRWTLENYISFVTRVMFWMGIVFQTPLLIFFLAKLNVISAKQLARYRKYAILVISIIAALVTPTPDPINMMIVMVPLYLLYEVGIILARFARRSEPTTPNDSTAQAPA